MTLITVDTQSMSVADAVRRSILHEEKFLRNMEDVLLLRQYASDQGFANTLEEMQLAADELRYQRGLESVEKFHQWLRASYQTMESVEDGIDDMLLRNKIMNFIPDSEIAAWYAQHQAELHSVELLSIRLDSRDKAEELLSQIRDDGASFRDLAAEHSTDTKTRAAGGYVGHRKRGEVTGEVAAAVFVAQPGTVVGPLKTEHGYNLLKVLSVQKPTLAEARRDIQYLLFHELLEKLRAQAAIAYPVLHSAV